jgi:hypothetical protein
MDDGSNNHGRLVYLHRVSFIRNANC